MQDNFEKYYYLAIFLPIIVYLIWLQIRFIVATKYIKSLEEFLALETTVKNLIEVVRQEEDIKTSSDIICSTFANLIKSSGMCIFSISRHSIAGTLGEYFENLEYKNSYMQLITQEFLDEATQIETLDNVLTHQITKTKKRFTIETLLTKDLKGTINLIAIFKSSNLPIKNKKIDSMISQILHYCAHLVGVALDIKHKIQVEKLLAAKEESEKHAEELQKQLVTQVKIHEQQNEFISVISHEFRTPLNVISSSIRLLQINTSYMYSYLKNMADQFKNALATKNPKEIISILRDKESTLREDLKLDKIDEQIKNINNYIFKFSVLIESTLNFTKIESNTNLDGFQCSQVKIDLNQAIKEIIPNFQNLREEVTIEFIIDNNHHNILFDKSSLYLVLSNLLSNAIKFSNPNSVVKIKLFMQDGHSNVVIEDKGIGIPKENLDKIFQKFYRAHNAKTISGTGIGLYLVKKLMELNGGVISIESDNGRGTKLQLVFLNNKAKKLGRAK